MTMTSDAITRRAHTLGECEMATTVRRLPAGLVRVAVTGDVDLASLDEFRSALDQAAKHRPERLQVDLSAVTFCASGAVDAVVRLRHVTDLSVTGATAPTRRLFVLAGAEDLLD
jgi:anti-anti-sigma regulatory factor